MILYLLRNEKKKISGVIIVYLSSLLKKQKIEYSTVSTDMQSIKIKQTKQRKLFNSLKKRIKSTPNN